MTENWAPTAPGVLELPSGRTVRGWGLRLTPHPGPDPTFGLFLLNHQPPEVPWEHRWVRWPDFWVPSDPADAMDAIHAAWERASAERVQIACAGGRGRTGTVLACLAVLDGLSPRSAVAHVRSHYHPRAVETPWQRRFITRFART